MFGADGRVAAVLDWELSTLGHPLADLAYSAMPYHLPSGTPALPSLPSPLPPGALLLGVVCLQTTIRCPTLKGTPFCLLPALQH